VPNYRLSAIDVLDTSYRQICNGLKTSELGEAAKAFVGNMNRIIFAASFPMWLLNLDERFQPVWQEARRRLTGDHLAAEKRKKWLEVRPSMPEECKKLLGDPAIDPAFPDPDALKYLRSLRESGSSILTDNSSLLLESIVACTGDFLSAGVESMLSNMLIGTWTAFETLAEDLWVEAVNCHPEDLSLLTGKRGKAANSKPADSEKNLGRQIELSRLQGYKFDVRTVMGTLLRDAKKVYFDKLERIRESYELAFGAVAPQVCEILDSPALDDLTIVRNLFAHSAGFFDDEYKKRAKNRPHLPQPIDGGRLPLNGELVANLINPTVDCTQRFIRAVDDWISPPLLSPADSGTT
jgi:hypothetical protein